MNKRSADTLIETKETRKKNILVVDDERAFGRAVQRRLEKDGFCCEHVASLEEARISLEKTVPDLLILDMRLPDGTGLTLLKELGIYPKFPIIVLTAYSTVENAVESMKLLACDYLSKPVDLDKLSLMVRKLLIEWASLTTFVEEKNFGDNTLADMECSMIRKALDNTSGNVSKAARQLGLGRMALRHRIRKYKISTVTKDSVVHR